MFGSLISWRVSCISKCMVDRCTWVAHTKQQQATHGFWSFAGLQMPIHAHFYRPAIWTRKARQDELVFDVRSGFASGSVHITSLCVQRLRLRSPWLSKNWLTDSYILTPVTLKSRSNPTLLYTHPCQMHPQCKFGDCRSGGSSYFPQNLIRPFWYLWPRKVGQDPGICCTHVRYTQDPNFVTADQQVAQIMQL